MKNQTKKNKRAYVIVGLIVGLLLLAVGYAGFTETLNITGTVSGTPTWEVVFDSSSTGGSSAISNDGHTLTANITLDYPGDSETITAVIKNNSSMPMQLTDFDVTGPASDQLTLTNETLAKSGANAEVIPANGTCTYVYSVSWNAASKASSVSGSYSFTFDYEQNTTAGTPTSSHTHS